MEHNFRSQGYTVGVEEELMILDGQTLDLTNGIEEMLGSAAHGEVKPELMESVLEISTDPCATIAEAATQLRELRHDVSVRARAKGFAIGAAGTHPFAKWEDQRIAKRPRYRDLISALRFVARQELIFGMHVHVGLDDAETAIAVANGMRMYCPMLLGLSANSPYWRDQRTGLQSTRMPIFRAFPRVGIPPYYKNWDDYQQRIAFQIESGVIEDYTYLWYDVRPHPKLGTVEIRAMDVQTRVEHTAGIAALVQCLVRKLATDHQSGVELPWMVFEMLDENRWLAARHGLDGDIVDLPSAERIQMKALVRRTLDEIADHATELGCADELLGVVDLLERGNGAKRQVVVYDANNDMRELLAEIVEATDQVDEAPTG